MDKGGRRAVLGAEQGCLRGGERRRVKSTPGRCAAGVRGASRAEVNPLCAGALAKPLGVGHRRIRSCRRPESCEISREFDGVFLQSKARQ